MNITQDRIILGIATKLVRQRYVVMSAIVTREQIQCIGLAQPYLKNTLGLNFSKSSFMNSLNDFLTMGCLVSKRTSGTQVSPPSRLGPDLQRQLTPIITIHTTTTIGIQQRFFGEIVNHQKPNGTAVSEHHALNIQSHLLGRRQYVSEIDTGTPYLNSMKIMYAKHNTIEIMEFQLARTPIL